MSRYLDITSPSLLLDTMSFDRSLVTKSLSIERHPNVLVLTPPDLLFSFTSVFHYKSHKSVMIVKRKTKGREQGK